MEMVEIECHNCGKKIYVHEEFVREQMFCTLGCLDRFGRENNNNKIS